jgi:hypothetical protein
MAPLSYYWLISFIYLVMKTPLPFQGILADMPEQHAGTLHSENFFLISGFFLFLKIPFTGAKKKICIYVSIRYYELQRVVQQVPDYG